jgi:hypothetical protein
MILRPFDYVELKSGDLACVMWEKTSVSANVGFVFYSSSPVIPAGIGITFGRRNVWKVFKDKERTFHDCYVVRQYPHQAVVDEVGGQMICLPNELISRHYSALKSLQMQLEAGSEILVNALRLLKLSPQTTGITGSVMLGRSDPPDLDLIIYDSSEGASTAGFLRTWIHSNKCSWLPGYWGRQHHHRRFKLMDHEVCPKFPLPEKLMKVPVKYIGKIDHITGSITCNIWGHCSPSMYSLKVNTSRDFLQNGAEVYIFSSESAHSFAFNVGDDVVLQRCDAWHTSDGIMLTIQMGDVHAFRPESFCF